MVSRISMLKHIYCFETVTTCSQGKQSGSRGNNLEDEVNCEIFVLFITALLHMLNSKHISLHCN